MAEEGKGIALAILGIVAVIAVVGLVMLFKGGTGGFVGGYGSPKVYPGHVVQGDTGPGFQYAGEGAYVGQQQGDCLSNEFFIEDRPYGVGENCRPGVLRIYTYQNNRKFFGAPNPQSVVDGWCCLKPNDRVPTGETTPQFR
jgi:hypothetical protein